MNREMLDLDQVLRRLDFPLRLAADSFASPNFPLVAGCLVWLLQRVDPAVRLPRRLDTEPRRARFLHAALQAAQARAGLRLDARRLYGADAAAVPELARLAALLQPPAGPAAVRATQLADPDEGRLLAASTSPGADADSGQAGAADPLSERRLGNSLAAAGSALQSVLERERCLRTLRNEALSLPPEEVRRRLEQGAAAAEAAAEAAAAAVDALALQERAAQARLAVRRGEAGRAAERLAALAGVRPAHQGELERLQAQLGALFTAYLQRSRNLEWLEARLDSHQAEERAQLKAEARRKRRRQRRMAAEELRLTRGGGGSDAEAVSDGSSSGSQSSHASSASSRSAQAASPPGWADAGGGWMSSMGAGARAQSAGRPDL